MSCIFSETYMRATSIDPFINSTYIDPVREAKIDIYKRQKAEHESFSMFRESEYDRIRYHQFEHRGKMLEAFRIDRSALKQKNKELHHIEYHNKKHMLDKLLESLCNWHKFPSCIRGIKFIQARWLIDDGGYKAFIGEDCEENYWTIIFVDGF